MTRSRIGIADRDRALSVRRIICTECNRARTDRRVRITDRDGTITRRRLTTANRDSTAGRRRAIGRRSAGADSDVLPRRTGDNTVTLRNPERAARRRTASDCDT
ncbi:hypothetical protein [Burkholderia territorii]|uniref:hypothetical protein n=1 Tax=Burkholderia territorii TaxID=1503055 RepID=UPI001E4A10B9|nr:hypothetical protein [Burkholderia territorii]